MGRADVKEMLLVIVTATSTWVFFAWTQPDTPICCPGGPHQKVEGGRYYHRYPVKNKQGEVEGYTWGK